MELLFATSHVTCFLWPALLLLGEATGVYNVRRMAEANIYAPEKLKDAREWLYKKGNKYRRRSDIKSTIALLISGVALLVSG